MAETARVQLQLERVLFVPAGTPPHKQTHTLSAPEHRAALVQAAIADNGAFALSRVDLDRSGPHYTVDMLTALRAQFSNDVTWFLLMGEDSLRDLPQWYQPEEILRQVTLAVMMRHSEMAGHSRMVGRANRSGPALVPPGVAAYIEAHRLYK